MAEQSQCDYKLAPAGAFRNSILRTVSLSLPAWSPNTMKTFIHSRDTASKGAALMIVLAFVMLLAGVSLAYFSRTTTERQLAQSSYNDTSADLLARSALDIVVNDFKQEILSHPTVTPTPPYYIQPQRYGDASIPNLIRRSYSGDPTNR